MTYIHYNCFEALCFHVSEKEGLEKRDDMLRCLWQALLGIYS